MDFRIGIVIGASLWLVTAGDPNKGCITLTDIFEPCGCTLSRETIDLICASDGHTYLNMCSLDCQKILSHVKISVVHKGICTEESQCNCQAGYAPLCGSNSITYQNKCVFDCFMKMDSTIRFEHSGECVESGEIIILDSNQPKEPQEPDNGSSQSGIIIDLHQDQENQNNESGEIIHLRQEEQGNQNSKSGKIQRCPHQPQACPRTGPERKPKSNKCLCAAIHRPVCSNHNTTYSNFCVVDCISRRNPSIEFQHWGACGKPQKTPWDSEDPDSEKPKKRCVCAMNNRPVCSNDEHTYANFCVLHCTAKRDPSVEFQHWGACGKPQKTPWGL